MQQASAGHLDSQGAAERLIFEIKKRRNHPAILAAGLGDVLDTLAQYIAETGARLRELEGALVETADRVGALESFNDELVADLSDKLEEIESET